MHTYTLITHKKWVFLKRQQVLLIKLSVMMTIVLLLTGCSKTSTDIEEYLNTGTAMDAEAKDVMPALDELPAYRDIDYRHTQKKIFLFEANSVALVVEYDMQTYESEKGKLEEDYIISNQKAASETSGDNSNPNVEFSLNSYVFRVLEGNGYPKSFGMVGTSDEHQRIAYLYFYDFDLDKIGELNDKNRMSKFVESYFDYDF
ncbi:hypothetical protein QTL97_16560 [Sporosarcina thermotolerans]|uniref:Lipoprotein n=1 Tax=Sporosarcina thermotolerans TaxID=633404 RepID=A0AAW9AFX4_9BACL|nr:hypothetical protein [Sporosarcina thermotolerans]MDW0118543.1 hypothetical protein [Sporosarcina thermotolerans]WHT49514.1 hypothetical protein QNH10_08375 [Sporosarcina thermotolerans]